jgi:hypothetical protein
MAKGHPTPKGAPLHRVPYVRTAPSVHVPPSTPRTGVPKSPTKGK